MKPVFTIIVFLAFGFSALLFTSFNSKTNSMPSIVETTMPMWEMTKAHTLEVLDAMPEEKFNYKPTEESMTFGEQMVHIAYTVHFFNERMIQGKNMKYEQPDASSMSKAEIREMMAGNMDAMMETIQGLSQEQLSETRPFSKETQITVAQVILFAHDHTTNHRAKANLYLRMNDMQPPNYKFL